MCFILARSFATLIQSIIHTSQCVLLKILLLVTCIFTGNPSLSDFAYLKPE